MSATTRSAVELAACLREIADMLDAANLGELACPARVRVSIDGPPVGDHGARLALVDQLASVTGNAPTWDRRSGGEYAWYETALEDRAMLPWSLFCNAYVKHPFGDLRTENDALRARLAEIEGIASGAKTLPVVPAQTASDRVDGSPSDLDVPPDFAGFTPPAPTCLHCGLPLRFSIGVWVHETAMIPDCPDGVNVAERAPSDVDGGEPS